MVLWRGVKRNASDVDLMIVGSLKQIDLLPSLRKLESRFGREVNITLFAPEESRRKLAAGGHFLKAVLKGKTISLKGVSDELEETSSRQYTFAHGGPSITLLGGCLLSKSAHFLSENHCKVRVGSFV